MRAAFDVREYHAGFEHLRQAMLQGLQELPADHNAGSFMIGAYCALVRVVWDRRDPGASRTKVAAVLGSVLSDVLREADGETPAAASPVAALLDAMQATTEACAPRDDLGRLLVDGETVLAALAGYVAELLSTVDDAAMRQVRLGEFGTLVENLVDSRTARPSPLALRVIQGGAA